MTQKATLSDAIQQAVDETLLTVGTSIPGYILNFDPETQLAEVQIGIKRYDKAGESFDPPPIIRVPVLFSGGSFRVEYQLDTGDEGLIIFSQRCIDAWVDQGGIATNPILRKHDMTDAIFIPGVRSQANKLSGFQNDGVRITDGTNYVWLNSSGGVEIKASNVNIESDTLTHNGTNIGDDHGHPYTWTDPAGSGTTGGPQ